MRVERVKEDRTRLDVVRHIGTADPNQMNSLNLALALAAGKPYHLFFYGVYRTEFLRRAFEGFPNVMAGDRLFICQIALATKFQYVDEVLHVRTRRKAAIADRYKDEALGRIWQDFWGPEKTVLGVWPISATLRRHPKPPQIVDTSSCTQIFRIQFPTQVAPVSMAFCLCRPQYPQQVNKTKAIGLEHGDANNC